MSEPSGVRVTRIIDAAIVNDPTAAISVALADGYGPLAITVAEPPSLFLIETQTLVGAMTTPATVARQILIDAMIRALKTAGVWSKLDVLWLFAAADSQAARLNWKSPGAFTVAVGGTPTFTADRGYAGNGIDGQLNTGWVASINAVNYAQNSACHGVWMNTDAAEDRVDLSALSSGSLYIILDTRLANGNAQARINNGAQQIAGAVASSIGFTIAKRTGATADQIRKNNAQVATGTDGTSGVPDTQLIILTGAGLFSTKRVAAAFLGAGLSDTESDALYNALNTYLTAVGGA